MVTPIEVYSTSVNRNTKEFNFPIPLKAVSIVNDGPDSMSFWIENSGQHTLNSGESLDIDSEYEIRNINLISSGTSNTRFIGTRKFVKTFQEQPPAITRTISERTFIPNNYQTPPVQHSDNNLLYLGVITLGIISVVAVIALAMIKK